MTTPRTDATSLVRQVSIDAPVATVFKYMIDPSLMTKWMGQACIFEPFEGGEYRCEINENIVAAGRVLEVVPDQKIVYTFGWEGGENPVTVGLSKVEITLEEQAGSTLVVPAHSELAGAVAEHGGGGTTWRGSRSPLQAAMRAPTRSLTHLRMAKDTGNY